MDKFIVIVTDQGRKVGECRLSEIGDHKSFAEIQNILRRDWYIKPAKGGEENGSVENTRT